MITLREFRPGDEPALRAVFGIAVPTSAAGRTAQPCHRHSGFEIVDRHRNAVRGVELQYAAMRKVLRAAP